jgi:hypothetical protein
MKVFDRKFLTVNPLSLDFKLARERGFLEGNFWQTAEYLTQLLIKE